jgi:hypothetical protein
MRNVKFCLLQDHAKSIWGDEDLSCISLNPGTSAMHKLRRVSFAAFPLLDLILTIGFMMCVRVDMKSNTHLCFFKGRPQPSWDRTCTAAAAAGLISELQLLPRFSSIGLDTQSEAVEHALTVLLDALTKRRLRMGRSITRKVRPNNIC